MGSLFCFVLATKLPNGSKIAYNLTRGGTSEAVSHSTEDGEENSVNKLYTLDVPTKITSGSNTVLYTYDSKRRVTNVDLNGVNNYVTYAYSKTDGFAYDNKITATMGDIASTVTKDAYGNVTETTLGNRTVTNVYSKEKLTGVTESIGNSKKTTAYSYNDDGKISTVSKDGVTTETYVYENDRLAGKTVYDGVGNHNYTYGYTTDSKKALSSISVKGNTVNIKTDALGRAIGKSVIGEIDECGYPYLKEVLSESITYVKDGDHTTNMPSVIRYSRALSGQIYSDDTLSYKYDSMGNLSKSSYQRSL